MNDALNMDSIFIYGVWVLLVIWCVMLIYKILCTSRDEFNFEDIKLFIKNQEISEEYNKLYNMYNKLDDRELSEIAARKDFKIESNKLGMGMTAFVTLALSLFCSLFKDVGINNGVIGVFFGFGIVLAGINYYVLTEYIGYLVWQRKIIENVNANSVNGDVRRFFVTVNPMKQR